MCAAQHSFPVDYDIKAEFEGLKEGYQKSILCEGCGAGAIANVKGKCAVFMTKYNPNKEYQNKWVEVDPDTNKIIGELKLK